MTRSGAVIAAAAVAALLGVSGAGAAATEPPVPLLEHATVVLLGSGCHIVLNGSPATPGMFSTTVLTGARLPTRSSAGIYGCVIVPPGPAR